MELWLEIGIDIHVNPDATLIQVILTDLDANFMRQAENPNADFFLPTFPGTMSSV